MPLDYDMQCLKTHPAHSLLQAGFPQTYFRAYHGQLLYTCTILKL